MVFDFEEKVNGKVFSPGMQRYKKPPPYNGGQTLQQKPVTVTGSRVTVMATHNVTQSGPS